MRSIKLMPDYGCFPLWEASSDIFGNINPEELTISRQLKEGLFAWAEWYDSTLNIDDPINSGFSSPNDQRDFENEGRSLAARLREELGENYIIIIKL